VDEVLIFFAPKILGDGKPFVEWLGIDSLEEAFTLYEVKYKKIGEDFLIQGKVKY